MPPPRNPNTISRAERVRLWRMQHGTGRVELSAETIGQIDTLMAVHGDATRTAVVRRLIAEAVAKLTSRRHRRGAQGASG